LRHLSTFVGCGSAALVGILPNRACGFNPYTPSSNLRKLFLVIVPRRNPRRREGFPEQGPPAHLCQRFEKERGTKWALQELLDHKTPAMTQRYSHSAPEKLQNAVKLQDGVIG